MIYQLSLLVMVERYGSMSLRSCSLSIYIDRWIPFIGHLNRYSDQLYQWMYGLYFMSVSIHPSIHFLHPFIHPSIDSSIDSFIHLHCLLIRVLYIQSIYIYIYI